MELPFDPLFETDGAYAFDVAGARSIGQTVQRLLEPVGRRNLSDEHRRLASGFRSVPGCEQRESGYE